MSDAHESGAEAFGRRGNLGGVWRGNYHSTPRDTTSHLESKIRFWAAELRVLIARVDLCQSSQLASILERIAHEMLEELK